MHDEYSYLQKETCKTPWKATLGLSQNLTDQLMDLSATQVISLSGQLRLTHHQMPGPQRQISQPCVPQLFFQVLAGSYCHTDMTE